MVDRWEAMIDDGVVHDRLIEYMINIFSLFVQMLVVESGEGLKREMTSKTSRQTFNKSSIQSF